MKRIVIIGAGGYAREVAWLLEQINSIETQWELLGFIDENPASKGKVLNGYPVLGDFDSIDNKGEVHTVCAVGNPKSKFKLVKRAKTAGLKFTNLIHPGSILSGHVDMGEGNIICAGTIISTNVKIGSHVGINPASTVGHDSVVGDYSTILWSVNISGSCKIETGCDIGTNSCLIQGITLGCWSIIGAGAVVVRDVPRFCTAVGVPAKPIKFHEATSTVLENKQREDN